MYTDNDRLNKISEASKQELNKSLHKCSKEDFLPRLCTRLSELLGPVPRYLDGSSPNKLQKICNDTGMYFHGTSTFQVAHGSCSLKPKVIKSQLKFAAKHLTPFTSDNKLRIQRWFPGCHESLLTAMVLAWSYILSSYWAETVQQHDITLNCKIHSTPMVSLTEGINFEAAGLSNPQWWKIVTSRSWCVFFSLDNIRYYSPWALKSSNQQGSHPCLVEEDRLPSSEQALKYLEELCSIYGVEQLCIAALSTALFIPFLHEKGLSLPPINSTLPPPSGPPEPTEKILQQLELLPYYMTLSSDPWGLFALLQGAFYTDKISCDELGAWILPIIGTINTLIENEDTHKIGFLFADRAPRVAPLWIGALLAGALESIMEPTRLGLFAISLPSAAWTSTRHSFIGPFQYPRPILYRGERLDRSDEAVLLYLTQDVRPPTTPWKPFGDTTIDDTDLVVREHLGCGFHFLQYKFWSLDDGTHQDFGFAMQSTNQAFPTPAGWLHDDKLHQSDTDAPIHSEAADDEDIARNATKIIFGWMRRDGWPPNEQWIFEWTKDDTDDDEDIDQSSSPITSIQSC